LARRKIWSVASNFSECSNLLALMSDGRLALLQLAQPDLAHTCLPHRIDGQDISKTRCYMLFASTPLCRELYRHQPTHNEDEYSLKKYLNFLILAEYPDPTCCSQETTKY